MVVQKRMLGICFFISNEKSRDVGRVLAEAIPRSSD